MSRKPIVLIGLLLTVACSATREENPFDAGSDVGSAGAGSSGAATAGVTSAGGSQGTDAGDETTDEDGSDDGPSEIYDVGAADDSAGPQTDGCTKIDFLFVVDNSGSMGAHQTALVNSFGPFIETIFATVQAQDFQIMVTDSDAGDDIDGACEPCTPNSFWCGDWCEAKADLDVACERTLGAGGSPTYSGRQTGGVTAPDGRELFAELHMCATYG